MEEKRLSLRTSNNPEVYFVSSNKRRWELSYKGRDKIYLTDIERDAFLKAVVNGAEIIQIGDLTLTKFFQFLVPVRGMRNETVSHELPKMSDEERKRALGKLDEIKKKWKIGG